MITSLEQSVSDHQRWIIRPNRSMSWREAKIFVAGVSVASLSIGIYFLCQGYPMVLPFSGLESLAIAVAFYLVLDAGEHTEIISIGPDRVIIEKGKRKPTSRSEFQRAWTRITVLKSRNRWYPSKLLIGSHGNNVEIGQFLSEGERKALAKMLINVIEKKR